VGLNFQCGVFMLFVTSHRVITVSQFPCDSGSDPASSPPRRLAPPECSSSSENTKTVLTLFLFCGPPWTYS
jgi:hypothetical protein